MAAASDRVSIIVDASKLVARLGAFPLPIEVLPFAGAWVMRALAELGGTATRRPGADGSPFRTNQGNFIFDAAFGPIEDAIGLAAHLAQVPGIVEHGLFLDEIDAVFIGRSGGVDVRRRSVLRRCSPRRQSFRTTHVVIDRWPWTTVVFNGSSSRPPSRRVSAMSIGSSTR